tara:strand:+ start:278 stop:589 length:312 start_codon:yes stop_codon:yes gene_type:complete
MKNYNKNTHTSRDVNLDAEDIMNDFNRLNNLLSGLDNLNPNANESELESIQEISNQIKDEFEGKYKDHLTSKDYLKEKEEIIKFGEETKKEIKDFKSNLDSLK